MVQIIYRVTLNFYLSINIFCRRVCSGLRFFYLSKEKSGRESEERSDEGKVIYHVFKLCLMKMNYYNLYNKLNCTIILIYSDNTYVKWINIFFTNSRLSHVLFSPPSPSLPPASAWPDCQTSYYPAPRTLPSFQSSLSTRTFLSSDCENTRILKLKR